MELTRRDAMAALAALGATGGVVAGAHHLGRPRENGGTPSSPTMDEAELRSAMAGVATVVYPAAVTGIDDFVDSFLDGRLDGSERADRLRQTVSELDELAEEWHGAPIVDLPPETIDQLLREVGADVADEHPTGTTPERVRYFVVNELLLALYASPAGSELVGLENPPGHPGGTGSYARGPS